MFGKLLIAIRRWMGARVKDEETPPVSPLSWPKTGDAGPPQHWLEAIRRAGPMTRVAAEQQSAPPSPNDSSPKVEPQLESAVDDQGTDFPIGPSLSLEPRETEFRSSVPWQRGCLEWVEQVGNGISRAMVPLFRRPVASDPIAAPVWSQPANANPNLEMTMTKTTEAGRPQSQTPSTDKKERFNSEETHQRESVFPTSWSQQNSIIRFPEAARGSSFPSLRPHGEKKIPDRSVPARGIDKIEAENTAPFLGRAIPEPWPLGEAGRINLSPIPWAEVLDSNPAPSAGAVSWPELPDTGTSAPAEFLPLSGVETSAPGGFPAEIRNSWPELAPGPVTETFRGRSVLRTLLRSQCLEREQRGF